MIQDLLSSRYVILREIGEGGMAIVYLAHEIKHGREVAIKVLRSEVTAAVGTQRFLREIGIAARLAHPHLVPLIDSGVVEGVFYYVSAYMPGGSLRDRLQRQAVLTLDYVSRVARDTGAALDYMHRHGVVHRDVKPENILFADEHALLADFGLARAIGADDVLDGPAGGIHLTSPGIVMGTAAYMSPEQAAGERHVDRRSDIYSLACVIYEMLAGRPPVLGLSARATIARQISAIPARVRTFRPDLPAAVDDALALALEKNPVHRFDSVAAFIHAFTATPPPLAPASAIRTDQKVSWNQTEVRAPAS